jgi:putative transposase
MSGLKIKRRNLPHWVIEDAVYFITFNTFNTVFSNEEMLIVKEHIVNGSEKFYDLYAAVVMNNHVHVILKPINGYTLTRITKGIKGVSANQINKSRNSTGSIWQDESFDRIIRDADEFDEKLLYMYNNPIKAGLTEDTSTYHGWYLNERLL